MNRILPDGGKAWFVRQVGPGCYQLKPCSIEGVMLTIGYALLVVAGSVTILMFDPTPHRSTLIGWGTFLGVVTILFLVTSLRHSVRERVDWRGKPR